MATDGRYYQIFFSAPDRTLFKSFENGLVMQGGGPVTNIGATDEAMEGEYETVDGKRGTITMLLDQPEGTIDITGEDEEDGEWESHLTYSGSLPFEALPPDGWKGGAGGCSALFCWCILIAAAVGLVFVVVKVLSLAVVPMFTILTAVSFSVILVIFLTSSTHSSRFPQETPSR